MTYEFAKPRGRRMAGLGAMGFSDNWHTADASGRVMNSPSCSSPSGGHQICVSYNEDRAYMAAQGCLPSTYRTADGSMTLGACRTASGDNGNVFCCPRGRPAAGAAPAVTQIPVTRADIIALQTWINQQAGCSAGAVDGVWGPNTRTGLDCASRARSWTAILEQFPFVNTLYADPTGQARPANTVFDPGTGSGKTPEQVGVQTGSGGGRQPAADQPTTPPPQEANIFGQIFGILPWWGWLGIAGGVGLLAILGVALMKGGEEEDLPGRLPA